MELTQREFDKLVQMTSSLIMAAKHRGVISVGVDQYDEDGFMTGTFPVTIEEIDEFVESIFEKEVFEI